MDVYGSLQSEHATVLLPQGVTQAAAGQLSDLCAVENSGARGWQVWANPGSEKNKGLPAPH